MLVSAHSLIRCQPAQQAFPIELLLESQSGSKKRFLPSPVLSFFCSRPNFLDELARKRLLRRLIRCDLLSLNPVLFICNFPVLFFHTTTTKSFTSKPIFWCTTLITLYIQIHAKGRLNKLLPLLLIFWVAFAPCLCTTPCRLKGNLKDCYAGHIFFFIFIYPLQFFISM